MTSLAILVVAFWVTKNTIIFYILTAIGLLGCFVVQAPVSKCSCTLQQLTYISVK